MPYFFKSIDNRQQSVAIKFVALKTVMRLWIAFYTDQKPQYNLKMLMFSFFAKSCFAKLLFGVNFKIQCGYIIKHNADVAIQIFFRMLITDLLYLLLLGVVQLIQVMVNFIFIYTMRLKMPEIIGGF